MPSSGIQGRLQGHDLNQIRAEFIRLYLVEGKRLEQVAEIFKDKGIHATKQQWKTQITLWNLGKNNKETDMVFAASKAERRKAESGKDTVFIINGQVRMVEDVKRYFKRRRRAAKEYSSVAETPHAISYFTPAGSPLVSASDMVAESEDCTGHEYGQQEVANAYPYDQHVVAFVQPKSAASWRKPNLWTDDQCVATSRPIHVSQAKTQQLPSSLELPENLHNLESGLYAVQEYYGRSFTLQRQQEDTYQQFIDISRLKDCFRAYKTNTYLGNVYTAECTRDQILKSLPGIIADQNPFLLPSILYFMVTTLNSTQDHASGILLAAISKAVTQLRSTGRHSVLKFLRALTSSFDDKVDISRRLLRQMSDCIMEGSKADPYLQFDVLTWQVQLHALCKNWHDVITCLRNIRETEDFLCDDTGPGRQRRLFLLHVWSIAYIELEKYSDAFRMLEQSALVIQTDHWSRAAIKFLQIRGELRRRMKDIAAEDDLLQAFGLAQQKLGAAHGVTMYIQQHLLCARNGDRPWTLIF